MTTATLTELESPEWLADTLRVYENMAAHHRTAMTLGLDIRREIAELREQLKLHEARVLTDGTTIDGRNAEVREAQVALALFDQPAAKAVSRRIHELLRQQDEQDTVMEAASNAMRGARLSIELATAWLNRQAAAQGGPEHK